MKVLVEINGEMEVCEIVKAAIRQNKYNHCNYELCLIQPAPMVQAYVVSVASREEALEILGRLQLVRGGCVNLSNKPVREASVIKNLAGRMSVGE